MPPLSIPCGCAPARMPNFYTTKILSATPAGRGAYVPSLSTIFWAQQGTGNLIRYNVSTQTESVVLAAVGATSLRSLAFNSNDGFLYAADLTGANNTIRKINPATGASTQIVPGDSVGNDCVFCSSNNTVFFTGGGITATRVDTAGVVTQTATLVPIAACSGIEFSSSGVLAGGGGGVAEIDPVGLTSNKLNNAISYSSISFGTVSGFALVGRNISGANGVQKFDPVGLTVANIVGAPTGKFSSGGFSSRFGVHAMIDTVNGVAWFFDDTSAALAVLGQFSIGVTTGSANDSFPVEASGKLYIPATTSKALNIFQ